MAFSRRRGGDRPLVDFGNLAPVDIDRIEILRGPQSALYGSDAMGGVINVVTRKGAKTPRRNVTVEAGSYGTLRPARRCRAATMAGPTRSASTCAQRRLSTLRLPHRQAADRRPTDPLPLPADDPTNEGGLSGHFSYKL